MSVPPHPGRLATRGGVRPLTAFGRDDSGLRVDLHTFRTADRMHWDALLVRPSGPGGYDDLVVVLVHGAMGNYLAGVPRRTAFELARRGLAVLSVNTRMANFGVVYGSGLLERTPADLDGALGLARELGYSRVVLAGYGQGATCVTHHQALRRPPEVVALVGLQHPASLARATAERWAANRATPGYDEVCDLARGVVAGERPDRIVVVARGSGPTDAPEDCEVWSLGAFASARLPESPAGDSVASIGRVGVPVCLVQSGSDLRMGYGAELATAARAAGVPVHLVHVPATDHTLWGHIDRVADDALRWLAERVPPAAGGGRPDVPDPSPSGVRRVLVTLTAPDGVAHDALLHVHDDSLAERASRTGRRTAVVHLHGNQGNFTVGALRYLPEPVAAAGVPVLSLEMRVGNVSQLFGGALFEEALVDVRAGVEWLLAHGFDHVVVSGYSMGAVVAVAFGAGLDGGPLGMLRGVAGAGTAWSTPEATHRRMHEYRAAPSYAELVERCRPPAGDPSLTDPVVVVDRAFGPEDHPRYAGVYTARTWWHFRGPEARMAMPGRHIGAITAPVLLIQGTADTLVRPEEADRLADAARQGGNQDVQVSLLEGATHAFSHHEEELVSVLAPWVVRVA